MGSKEIVGIREKMSSIKDEDAPRRQAIRSQIDENLKRVYQQAAEEEVPDRFLALLQQLREQE